MSQQHQVPSREFWTITPFRFTTPDGWTARQTTQHLAYMEREDEPSTNCGILWRRVAASTDIKTLARLAHNRLQSIDPRVEVRLGQFGKLNGRPTMLRICDFTPTDGSPRRSQTHVAFFGPRFGEDRPVELFEIIGHCEVTRAERRDEIQEIVKSFRFIVGSAEFGRSGDSADDPATSRSATDPTGTETASAARLAEGA